MKLKNDYTINSISYDTTKLFHKEGRKCNLIFHKNTNYLGLYDNSNLIAISGYVILKSKAVLRSSFVLPEHRGRGLYNNMVNYRINILKEKQIKIVEMTCTNMSINYHLKRGASIIKKYKKYTKIQYKL